MNKPSEKHHYLSQKYLQGFVNKEGKFFCYDKQDDKFFESTPKTTFFQKKLNTITFKDGHSSDFMEGMYAYIENISWPAFDNIRASSSTTIIAISDKLDLSLFLFFLHWRLPTNISIVENLSNTVFEDKEINFFSLVQKNGQKVSKEVLDIIKNDPAFKKSLKLLLPFAPFHKKDKDWQNDILRWRFLYPADNKNWYIVGDNPIITDGTNDQNPAKCLKEFVFPISGKILLVNTNPPPNQVFPPELIIQYNLALIHRANRFVASSDKNLLETSVKLYKFYKEYGKTEEIIPRFFEGIKLKK